MAIMQRITICGNSGSGKSTFSEKLGTVLGLPVFHLDLIQFRPGWELTPEKEFHKIHDNWLAEPDWIIEGVAHWPALVKRFQAADTIIYLDLPVEYCLQMAHKRLEQDKISPNPFVPENSPYAAKADKQEEVIRFFHRVWRPKILETIESLEQPRNLYIFTQPEGPAQFLAELKYPRL